MTGLAEGWKAFLDQFFPEEVTARLAGPALGSVGLKVSHAFLMLLSSVLLARILGPEGYGIYSFAYAVVMLLAVPCQAGLPTLLVRDVSKYETAERWGLIRGLLRRSNQGVALLTVAIAGTAVVVVLALGDRVSQTLVITFFWALILLPLMALGNLRGAALRGLRRVVQGLLPEQLIRPALLVLGLLALLVLQRMVWQGKADITPAMTMALHAGAALVAFVTGAWLLARWLPDEVRAADPVYRTRAWMGSVLPLTLLASIELVNTQTDIVLLGVLGTAEEVGVYRVVSHAATLIIFSLTAVNMVVGPYFAQEHAAEDRAGLQRLATWTARIVLATALPVGLTLIFLGEEILAVLFGQAYSGGAIALTILAVGYLVNAVVGSVGTLLKMTGYEHDTVRGSAIAAGLNVVLNLILIPLFGIEGAAIGTATSVTVLNLILYRRVRIRLGITSVAWGA